MKLRAIFLISFGLILIFFGLSFPGKPGEESRDVIERGTSKSSEAQEPVQRVVKPAGYIDNEALSVFSDRIKVATWNLQWFPGKKPGGGDPKTISDHLNAVKAELEKIDPDILLLQEIRDPSFVAQILEVLPDHSLHVMSDFSGNLEVGISARFPATEGYMEEFIAGATDDPPRGFAYAAFAIGNNVLGVYSVHLKSNSGGISETAGKREESARQLVLHAKKMEERFSKEGISFTALIGGDYNMDPTSSKWDSDNTFGVLEEGGFEWTGNGLAKEEIISWLSNGQYPDAVFDHFFIRGEDNGYTKPVTQKTDRGPSDHRAVIIELGL